MTVGEFKDLLQDVPEGADVENLDTVLITKVYDSEAIVVSIKIEIE